MNDRKDRGDKEYIESDRDISRRRFLKIATMTAVGAGTGMVSSGCDSGDGKTATVSDSGDQAASINAGPDAEVINAAGADAGAADSGPLDSGTDSTYSDAEPIPTRPEELQPPNILLILGDDHAAHAISAYGSKINQTPHLDRLAGEGILFSNCFVTNSLCAPSRAVILTGKHSHINGVKSNYQSFAGTHRIFPQLLEKNGYQTALFGKWHLADTPTGFDHFEILNGQGTYYNPDFQTPAGATHYTGYTTEIITDLALDWLKTKRDQKKPFFLMCGHKAAHRNWQPGLDYLTMYDGRTIPEPPTLFDDYQGRSTAAKTQTMTIAHHLRGSDLKRSAPKELNAEQLEIWNEAYGPKNEAFDNEDPQGDDLVRWKYQRYIKDYLRCVAALDDGVGRILDCLDKLGLADNTVVIYSSDQGFFLGDHGWFDKRFMYEESIRTPLIIRWPKVVPAGTVDDHMLQNLDFAPTILQIGGVKVPADMQGISFEAILANNQPVQRRESIYYHYYDSSTHSVQRHYGVRTRRYKLIHYYEIGEWELFDLDNDPNELRSVYGERAYSDIISILTAELARLRDLYEVTD